MNQTRKVDPGGVAWGLFSFALWGLFPIYWKLLQGFSALEILSHRMVWSFVFYLAIYLFLSRGRTGNLFKQSRKDYALSAVAALVLASNWGIFIYAVNSGHILEGSLAYFINPILNVAVGVLILNEAFPLALKLAVGFAAAGVAIKIAFSPSFPWISLFLASTFCAYGYAKKTLTIPARTSAVLEGAVAFLIALPALLYFASKHPADLPPSAWPLFIGSGVVTGLPLFIFSYAAQRVPYSILGIMQFVAPTGQFLVGVWMYGEQLHPRDLFVFGLIWLGIFFYVSYQLMSWRRRGKAPAEIAQG